MNVVLIGASGMIGSRVLRELITRGHRVTAVVRDPSKVDAAPGVTVVKGDVNGSAGLAAILRGADAVVSAYSPPQGYERQLISVTGGLLAAARQVGVKRVMIVGGAASLLVATGVRVLDSGHLPQEWVPIATAHTELLELLRATNMGAGLDWTYFSPAAFIQPGTRTGEFREGKDELVANEKGESRISAEDYAVALVDEVEKPRHLRERFTVGY